MFVTINSWNMQGGGRDKLAYLDSSLLGNKNNIILVQEAGVSGTTGFLQNEVYQSQDGREFLCMLAVKDPLAAMNERCTTAILVELPLVEHCQISAFYDRVYSTARPLVYVQVGGLTIATFHAIANASYSVVEVKNAISRINEITRNGNWILMGDFNSEPFDYDMNRSNIMPNEFNHIRLSGTNSRYDEQKDTCYIIYDRLPTQGPHGRRTRCLDYTFVGNSAVENIGSQYINGRTYALFYNNIVVDACNRVVSDHNIIRMDVKTPM